MQHWIREEKLSIASLLLIQQLWTSGLNTKSIRKSFNALCPILQSNEHKKNTMLKAIEIISSPNENKLKESVVVSSAKQKKTADNIKEGFR